MGVLLELSVGIEDQARRYAATAALQALGLDGGRGKTVGPEPAAADCRRDPVQVERLSTTNPPERRGAAASARLGAALTQLQSRSHVSLHDAACRIGLAPSDMVRILSGAHVPPWPVVHMLTMAFHGDPAELRVLWECSQGQVHSARMSAEGAAGDLAAALRGLHLAAGCPPLEQLAHGYGLSATAAGLILAGRLLPDWPATARLASALGGSPSDVYVLWREVHSAVIALYGSFPPPQDPAPPLSDVHDRKDL
ncbi:helix-turn-helix domain-containing protein [Streptomyces sp. NPDC048111]|uniref:helix-turn-helix domain-containing protein n=1 Tax=Streptomyces sp. NPDC048111 TaxID=3365500 RepID=UPI00371898D9